MDVKVKVCGLTSLSDAEAALAAGADLLGFIFFPKSPRYVTPEQVRDILAGLEPHRQVGQGVVLTVGVFVNESPQTVAQILDFCGLDLSQLHGEEPPTMLGLDADPAEPLGEGRSLLRGRAYKALRPRSPEEAKDMARRYALPPHLQADGHLPAFLLDAYHPQLRGGTGETGDWRLAASLAARYPLLLAGGLTPANVAQAVRPWGVDVASGVEKSPGQKDHAALRAFIAAANQMAVSREGIASDR
jgi:phosphoribosylanthranilate isomerase